MDVTGRSLGKSVRDVERVKICVFDVLRNTYSELFEISFRLRLCDVAIDFKVLGPLSSIR